MKSLWRCNALMALIVTLCLWSCSSNGTSQQYRTCAGATWGTTYRITYNSDRDMSDSIIAVMRRIELSLSPFDSNSIISKVNRGEDPEIDTLICEVFNTSKFLNRVTKGKFDPTLGPIIRLWGFGEDKSVKSEPSQAEIDSALRSVGIGDCEINDKHIIRKTSETQFNFSAITKGYGCDQVGEMFSRNGINDYMVEIGGEIAVKGKNPKGKEWLISIDVPAANDSTVNHDSMATIKVTDCGIATSGNYRNFRRYSSGTVGHTIDPSTGRPVQTETLSVTVVGRTAILADALATACMAMPLKDAVNMIESFAGVSAMFVTGQADGELRTITTEGFPLDD